METSTFKPGAGLRVQALSGASGRKRRNPFLLLLLLLGLLSLFLVTAVTAFQLRYASRVYQGVQVLGVDISELTLNQATARLDRTLTPFPGPSILLRDANQAWALSAADLGVQIDARATALQAYQLGRSEDPLSALEEQWNLLRYGARVTPVLTYGHAQATYLLDRVARSIDRPVRDAGMRIEDLDVITTPAQVGRRVDIDATWEGVQALLAAGRGGSVQVVVHELQPTVRNVDAAAQQARRMLATPLSIAYAGDPASDEPPHRYAIDQVQLGTWLSFQPHAGADGEATLDVGVDDAPIREFADTLAASLVRPSRDARLDFDPASGKISVLSDSQVGRRLDAGELVTRVVSALTAGEHNIELPLAMVKPAVDMRDIAQMGIKELVASGTTSFKGSSADRIHNIAHGTSQFTGVVVPPDGIFSFDAIVGDVSAANGYTDGLVIWGDRTAVGVGGGICQVSTTMFRTAFWAGVPIVERWAHGYVVGYYGEPGLDATIFTPSVDFRFRNDTGAYLLIKPDLDLAAGRLTFNFYGTKPDRNVEKVGPVITNVQKAPAALIQVDPTLQPGQRKQVDWAVDGRDVVVTRVIKQGDRVIKQDTFVSKYQPWRAIFLVGPTPAPAAPADGTAGG